MAWDTDTVYDEENREILQITSSDTNNNPILKLPPCPGQAQPAVDYAHGGGAAAAQDNHLPLTGQPHAGQR